MHGIGAMLGPAAAGALMNTFPPGSLFLYFALVLAATALFALWRLFVAESVPSERQQDYVTLGNSSPVVLEMDPRTSDPPVRPDLPDQ